MNAAEPVDLADVLRRVKKLLAIAEDDRADPNEASAAAGMAERIMRKYQLDHADVIELELKRGGAESFESVDCGSSLDPESRSEHASGWVGLLAIPVAELYDCQARYRTTERFGRALRFSGYASDAQMARFTYVYLVQTMAAASRAFLKADGKRTRSDAAAFRRGFGGSVYLQLTKALRAKKDEMATASSSRSLVLVKGDAVVKHFGPINYRFRRDRHMGGSAGAYAEGRSQGSKVDVSRRAVGADQAARRRLEG